MRSGLLSRFIPLIGALAIAACAGTSPPEGPAASPDLVLYNGKIVTVDETFSTAQALAIRNERFIAVGSNESVRRLAGVGTRSIDLRGRTVIPGLMDGHLHNAGGGPGVNLSDVRTMDELLSAIAARASVTRPGELIVSNSDWHEAQLREQRLPHLRDLDRAAPGHPVVLVRGGNQFIVNSAALRRWNITAGTASPPGGEIGRDSNGQLNGELVNTARRLVTLPPPAKLAVDEILAQMKLLNAAGLTGIRIPGSFQFGGDAVEPYRMFQALKAGGRLTMRVNYLMRIADYPGAEGLRTMIAKWNVKPEEGDEWLRIGGMKLQVDGGFEGGHMRTAYQEPFGRGGRFRGIQVLPVADLNAAVRELNQLGWRVATHAVGDAAIDQVIAAYALADRDRSIHGKRWVIEHVFIGRPEHYSQMRALDLMISAQNHLYRAGPSLVKYWGRARAEQVTPVRSFLDAGFAVAGGTDSPVIPYNPFRAMYHFISRETISDGVYGANQRITREEALRVFTINNAKLTFEEGIKGSIERGKLADLVILPADILSIPEKQIEGLKPVATMVGGRFVYTDPAVRLD
ncbi:MAG: amidohydrolase [Betaproteobacteria bacterium]|nr:amidohydrolase [Betaproteobacteria bacterium]